MLSTVTQHSTNTYHSSLTNSTFWHHSSLTYRRAGGSNGYAILQEPHNSSISQHMFSAAVDASQGHTRCQGRHITHWSPGERQCVQSLARCQRRHITYLGAGEVQCVQGWTRYQRRHITHLGIAEASVCRTWQDATSLTWVFVSHSVCRVWHDDAFV
jgi:hypothetical protein